MTADLAEIGKRAAALRVMKPGNRWTTDIFELVAEVRRLTAELAAEREACAKVCDDFESQMSGETVASASAALMLIRAAATIRARGSST